MSCDDIPSLLDLQNTKKHADDFCRLMGTGAGTSTNGVTGQVRPTYNKVINDMNAEFDAQIVNMGFTVIGKFSIGATLTNPRQTLLWDVADGGDGQEYGWSGAFPKVVPATSTPASTGGISVGAWMSRFDPELRVQVLEVLRRSYAEAGYNLVDGSFEAGGVVIAVTDVLLHEATGVAYTWGGALPKSVETNSTPDTAGGVSDAGWLPRGGITLREDLESTSGAGLVGTTSGATVQEALDDAVMYQDPLTKWPDGGTLKIKRGVYNVTTPLVMDYATHPIAFPGTPGVRNHYEGDNMPETIFNCNTGTFAIQMKGDNTYSSQRVHTYDYLGNMTLMGSPTDYGLLIQGKAYAKLENITALNFSAGEGIRLEGTITSEITNVYAQHNNIGIRVIGVNPTGSDLNAVTFNRISASNNATYGIYGERWGCSNVINGLTCEGNGTMGNMNTGGVLINIAGDFAAPAVVFNAPYFELNKGSADLEIVNTSATKPVTVVINGGLFNRASSEYCQTNIAVNSAGGQTKVILIGVVFANSAGYVPSDSRPYWILGNNCSVIDIGCLFDSPVGKATSPSEEGMVRTGRVAANGTVGVGVGFTVNKIATGVYDVVSTHGPFSTTNDGYMAIVQLCNATGTFCTNVDNLSASTFRVTISGSNTGVGTDVAFNFVVAKVL